MTLSKLLVCGIMIISCLAVVDRTYYIYLGLDISATHDQILEAYATKKQKIQGMQDGESKTNKLKLLQEAYLVLGNAEKRSTYDKLNKDLFKKDKVVTNLKKLTDTYSFSLCRNTRKGKPIQISLPVSVEDVYHGKTVQATFLKQVACEKCKGTGAESPKALNTCNRCGGTAFSLNEGVHPYGQKFVNENTCPVCQGSGKQVTKSCAVCSGKKVTTKLEKVKIKIPEGLPDGNIIKIPNFGDEPVTGAPSDLEATIIQIPTQKWSRDGLNLIHTVDLPFKDSVFGFKRSIIHLNGEQIPISRDVVTTQHTTINIPNKGIKNQKTSKQGNLIIKFKIIMPKFTNEQLDLWQEFFRNHNI